MDRYPRLISFSRRRAIFSSRSGVCCVFSDETVQDDDPPSDHYAVERAACSFLTFAAQFKDSFTHSPRVRQAQIRAVLFHQGDQPQEIGIETHWPVADFLPNLFVEVADCPVHGNMLANLRTFATRFALQLRIQTNWMFGARDRIVIHGSPYELSLHPITFAGRNSNSGLSGQAAKPKRR